MVNVKREPFVTDHELPQPQLRVIRAPLLARVVVAILVLLFLVAIAGAIVVGFVTLTVFLLLLIPLLLLLLAAALIGGRGRVAIHVVRRARRSRQDIRRPPHGPSQGQ